MFIYIKIYSYWGIFNISLVLSLKKINSLISSIVLANIKYEWFDSFFFNNYLSTNSVVNHNKDDDGVNDFVMIVHIS